jgi:16S rRNA (cytosine1402-N4)-methyltransferase
MSATPPQPQPSDLSVHIPILVEPIVESLFYEIEKRLNPAPSEKSFIIDCTFGGGGHSGAFLQRIEASADLRSRLAIIGVDQDESALIRAKKNWAPAIERGQLELFHGRFSEIKELVQSRHCIGLLADFGFSSDQIEDPERGLSFRADGPLDMRLDPSRGEGARSWLLRAREQDIEAVLREYGEERFSKKIAAAIVELRRGKGIPQSAKEFASFITSLMPPSTRYGRIHPATRVFQALRIQVNDELGEVERLLKDILPHLQLGARIALISFHSLEDRLVKWFFKENSHTFAVLTKKPIEADDEETARNPRSRSAKLRLAERTEPLRSEEEKGRKKWQSRLSP